MANVSGYYRRPGLNIDTYDLRSSPEPGSACDGDVEFFVQMARGIDGPVLELGSGTGRIAFPIAQAGVDVVGVDLSEAMIQAAEERRLTSNELVRDRVTFVPGDMATFDLGRTFPLVIVPFRAFQFMLTPEAQRACLERIRLHLRPDGMAVIDLFDPLLDKIATDGTTEPLLRHEVVHPQSGNRITVEVLRRRNDKLTQVIHETWRFTEIDKVGDIVRTEDEVLSLRWTYRYEMRYLLESCGFEIVREYSDYFRNDPAYGKEQVWVVRAAS